jgi:4-hydroxy-4-methyl-2-oxoglutarate aldolase
MSAWEGVSAASASDALNRFAAMVPEIRRLTGSGALVGRAWTARTMPADNSTVRRAVETAPRGSVLVIDARGCTTAAVWGEVMTARAEHAAIAGLVLDGAIRDVAAIARRGFPIYARAVCAAGGHKGWEGDVGVTIACGGVPVSPGDMVLADDDGVVVIPSETEERVLAHVHATLVEDRQKLAALEAR